MLQDYITFYTMFTQASCLYQIAIWRDLAMIVIFSFALSFTIYYITNDTDGIESQEAHLNLSPFLNVLHSMMSFFLGIFAFCIIFFLIANCIFDFFLIEFFFN